MAGNQAGSSQVFEGVKGYSIKTELDRKLFMGIWEQDAQKKADAKLKDASDLSSSKLRPKSQPNFNLSALTLKSASDVSSASEAGYKQSAIAQSPTLEINKNLKSIMDLAQTSQIQLESYAKSKGSKMVKAKTKQAKT